MGGRALRFPGMLAPPDKARAAFLEYEKAYRAAEAAVGRFTEAIADCKTALEECEAIRREAADTYAKDGEAGAAQRYSQSARAVREARERLTVARKALKQGKAALKDARTKRDAAEDELLAVMDGRRDG